VSLPGKLLEICVDSIDLALAAVEGGANRLELSGPLYEGGVTPGAGFVATARRMIGLPLAMLIRPRPGSFTPTAAEFAVMREDIVRAREMGVDILVLGLLGAGHTVDVERTRELVELARPLQVTFHRAFDESPDPARSLGDVLETGATRILTAGGRASAVEGAAMVKSLAGMAGGAIRFLLCGGITADSAEAARQAGVAEVHAGLGASARAAVASGNYELFREAVQALRNRL
jgi:copper homeostasis protein